MRVSYLARLFFVCSVFLLLFAPALANAISSEEATKLLPDRVGDFRAQKTPLPIPLRMIEHTSLVPKDFDIISAANTAYLSPSGDKFVVDIVQTESDSGAYALLSRNWSQGQFEKAEDVGIYGIITPQHMLAFYKGTTYVLIYNLDNQRTDDAVLINFARSFAQTLDNGTGEIPSIIRHLPGTAKAQEHAVYAISLPALKESVRNQTVLDAVSFDGGAEAVTAKYDQGQLVIVEFQTPQLASDTDARVGQRIAELRAQNQPMLSAYRRVGNYAVFVFDAPNEQAANALIEQVHYEKVVQWLGEDPHRNERANRYWLNMSGSLILNTVKATGLAILLCLGIGGLFGGGVFMRRRAQAALNEQYSDAGGMMRLNLDEFAAQHTQAAALPPHEE